MLRINVRFPMDVMEVAHKRHFYEGLAKCGKAEVSFGASAGTQFDYVFDAAMGRSKPPGAKTIALMTYDPHGLPHDFKSHDLVDPRFFSMLGTEDRHLFLWALHELSKSALPGHRSIVEAVVDQDYDVLAMNLDWPFRERLRPRMPPGRSYMRIGPRVPEWIFYPDWAAKKRVDVFFVGAATLPWYPLRAEIGKWLPRSGLVHQWLAPFSAGDGALSSPALFDAHQRRYAEQLRHAKIMPFCGSLWNICVGKYLEAMACGCLVAAPLPRDSDLFGFRDGVNMVSIGPTDFADKIRHYACHDAEREAIARRGADLVAARHSATAQAAEVVAKLEAFSGGKPLHEIEDEHDARLRAEYAAGGAA